MPRQQPRNTRNFLFNNIGIGTATLGFEILWYLETKLILRVLNILLPDIHRPLSRHGHRAIGDEKSLQFTMALFILLDRLQNKIREFISIVMLFANNHLGGTEFGFDLGDTQTLLKILVRSFRGHTVQIIFQWLQVAMFKVFFNRQTQLRAVIKKAVNLTVCHIDDLYRILRFTDFQRVGSQATVTAQPSILGYPTRQSARPRIRPKFLVKQATGLLQPPTEIVVIQPFNN